MWREEPLCMVASVHSPLARKRRLHAAALRDATWLLREPGSGTRDVADRLLHQLAIRPQRSIEIGSNEGIARAVAAGLGVALLPMRVVRELLALGEVAALKLSGAPKLVRPLWCVERRDRRPSPLVLAWREALARPLADPASRVAQRLHGRRQPRPNGH
jgi:DNA-binding transcriptional LysR family regulator